MTLPFVKTGEKPGVESMHKLYCLHVIGFLSNILKDNTPNLRSKTPVVFIRLSGSIVGPLV